jgi:hypothetical protein
MSAFFSTFVANEPDEDGDISFDTELTVTNETDQPVYQIQYKIWYLDSEGATFEESDSYEDVFLAPGDQQTISPWGRVNQRDLNGNSISVRGVGCLTRRDFRLLGEVAIPAAGESVRLRSDLGLGWSSENLTILVSRSAPDGDGDFSLEFKALIENKSSQFLKVVSLKGQLIDAEGVEIQNDETEREIPPESAVLYSSSFYSTKASQLEDAKAIFSLKALIPLSVFDALETTELSEE